MVINTGQGTVLCLDTPGHRTVPCPPSTNESGGSGSVERKDTTTGIAPRHGQYTMGLTVPTGAATGSFALTAHSGIPFEAGIPYTFSAYVKVPSTGFTWNSGGVLKAVLLDSNVDPITVLEASPAADIENGWQRVQATFTVGTSGTYRPGFQLEGVSGTVYIDDVQLEQSEAASVYNLVQNGSFEFDSIHWAWETQNTLISFDPTYFGNTMLRGTSPYNGVSRAQQIIPMNCSGDTTFQLSGWAKGESAPNPSGDFGDTKRFFGLALRIDYTDDTKEFHSVPFEWSNQDWQCAAGNIVPKEKDKTIREIRVFCAYDNNYGYAYFDNISLRQEPVATYSYNDEGELTSAAQTGNEKDGREYDGVDLVKYTAPNKVEYEYTYNDKHQTETVSYDGVKTTYDYDETTGRLLSSLTQESDGNGSFLQSTSAVVSNDPNHTASETDVNGVKADFTYNSAKELLMTTTDGKGVTINKSYLHPNDRLNMVYQSGVAAISYTYDSGRMSALTRKTFPTEGSNTALWQRYSFASNKWGQRTAVTVNGSTDGSTWDSGITLATYTYEANGGELTEQTYGNGNKITYEYDELDRLIKKTYNDTEESVSYAYTAEGNVGRITHNTGSGQLIREYTLEYDSLGRLIRSYEKDAAGTIQQTEHLYDTYNRLTKQRWNIGGRAFREEYSYNDPLQEGGSGDGSLKSLRTASGQRIYYNYDQLKRMNATTVKNSSGEELFKTTYAFWNKGGDRTSMQVEYQEMVGYFPPPEESDDSDNTDSTDSTDNTESIEDVITGWKYVYDAVGNIIALYESRPGPNYQYRRKLADFTYDDQNQLLSETYYTYIDDKANNYDTVTWHYTYDTAGNILSQYKTTGTRRDNEEKVNAPTESKTYTYGNSTWRDLLTAVDGSPIVYEGQTYTNGTVSGDVISGNPIRYTNGTKTYTNLTWQHGRQLASITTGGKTYTYDYDAEGIRTQKVVDGVVHSYITQNGKVVQESFPYGNTTVIMIFTYDEQGKPFGLWYSYDGGNSFHQYYYAINAQGDVEGIFLTKKNTTTGTQEVHWMGHYTYDAWGNITSITNAVGAPLTNPASVVSRNPLRYRGYYYDTETGFYYLQSRYYDPTNRRFINADCYTSTGMGFLGYNMFAYCNNTPANGSDPCGACYHSSDLSVNCHMCYGRPIAAEDFNPINGQSLCDYADMPFGFACISESGCGVLAIYNALGLLGENKEIETIIGDMSLSWHGRKLGVMPGEIADILTSYDIPYERASSSSQLSSMLSDGGMAIIMRWNNSYQHHTSVVGYGAVSTYRSPDYLGGAHVVLMVNNGDGVYTVYNRYSNRNKVYTYNSYEEYMGWEGLYIAGFSIG